MVTVIELGHGIERANSAKRRITREHFLDELLKEISVEPITVPIAFRTSDKLTIGPVIFASCRMW